MWEVPPVMLDLSVIIPVRNGEDLLEGCLESIVAAQPREIIIVDGMSTDGTLDIASRYPTLVISDEGKGLPAARMMGARAAQSRWIALVDADVVFPEGTLQSLYHEFVNEGYGALQAGQQSTAGPGYWGQALVWHHRNSRSKNWLGLVATIMERDVFLAHGLDESFLSGEDIEFRWRLMDAGLKIGVSTRAVVEHRYGDSWEFAKGQFTADGKGLARMVIQRGLGAVRLALLPLAAGLRGIVLAVIRRKPAFVPYFLAFIAYNYQAFFGVLVKAVAGRRKRVTDVTS